MKVEKHANLATCTVSHRRYPVLSSPLLIINGNIFGDRSVGIAIVAGIIRIGLINACH